MPGNCPRFWHYKDGGGRGRERVEEIFYWVGQLFFTQECMAIHTPDRRENVLTLDRREGGCPLQKHILDSHLDAGC